MTHVDVEVRDDRWQRVLVHTRNVAREARWKMNEVTQNNSEGTYIGIPYASPMVCRNQVELVAWYSGLDIMLDEDVHPVADVH